MEIIDLFLSIEATILNIDNMSFKNILSKLMNYYYKYKKNSI